MKFAICLLLCITSQVYADDLPRTEQLRVLILEAESDIADQRVILDAAWNAVTDAASDEMEVWSRMPWSLPEVYPAMARTTEATERWQEQLAIYEWLQSVRLNYEAELSGLIGF